VTLTMEEDLGDDVGVSKEEDGDEVDLVRDL
jgi:hypothetical protein